MYKSSICNKKSLDIKRNVKGFKGGFQQQQKRRFRTTTETTTATTKTTTTTTTTTTITTTNHLPWLVPSQRGKQFQDPNDLACQLLHTYFNRKYTKCLNDKRHPKIAWLIELGGSELHGENKSTISLSLNYLSTLFSMPNCARETHKLPNLRDSKLRAPKLNMQSDSIWAKVLDIDIIILIYDHL